MNLIGLPKIVCTFSRDLSVLRFTFLTEKQALAQGARVAGDPQLSPSRGLKASSERKSSEFFQVPQLIYRGEGGARKERESSEFFKVPELI